MPNSNDLDQLVAILGEIDATLTAGNEVIGNQIEEVGHAGSSIAEAITEVALNLENQNDLLAQILKRLSK